MYETNESMGFTDFQEHTPLEQQPVHYSATGYTTSTTPMVPTRLLTLHSLPRSEICAPTEVIVEGVWLLILVVKIDLTLRTLQT